ncbi:anti-anti-sigma factor RsfA [Mycobacterium tuberculosis]|nr:anti-anti-sigma factor RsfA [Mycobacterium tuberculosis]
MNPTQAGSFTTPVSNALKATIQHHDSAVIIHARGEIDAANEHTWQDLVTKAAAATTAPEPLVVNLSWAAAQSPSLLTRPNGVDAGAWTCAW